MTPIMADQPPSPPVNGGEEGLMKEMNERWYPPAFVMPPSAASRRRRWQRRFGSNLPKKMIILLLVVTLCTLLAVAIWLLVTYLERPAEQNIYTPPGTKISINCNDTDTYVSRSLLDRVSFRINNENSLLEIGATSWPAWLPVCEDTWNPTICKFMCRHMGNVRCVNYSVMSVRDIGPNYTHGFVGIDNKKNHNLEDIWYYRSSCGSGNVIKLKCSECGEKHVSSLIVGGSDASLGSWPWQVTLYNGFKHVCGGSIIDEFWILTAAHCVEKFPHNSNWFVYAGVVNRKLLLYSSLPTFYAETVIYHKDYDILSHDFDIALMKLKFPITFSDTVRPVCLPRYNQEFPAGKECWISGWGHSSSDAYAIEDKLKEASVPLISIMRCNSSCMYNGSLTPRMMCAGYKEGKVDACQGDSGGPLVCEDVYAWHLMGVVSWGLGCAEASHPGVYTKVTEFLDWIYNIIESH